MNQGGEPGHDDYGLPRVDVEIPDDARELDRDVQAYYRELRALRRHQRSLRWRAPLQRPGALLPLIAGCLLVAMLSGMVLTMFSANTDISGDSRFTSQQRPATSPARRSAGGAGPSGSSVSPGSRASHQASTAPSAPATRLAGRTLPDRTIIVAGQPVALRTLTSAALAIIPGTCHCAAALRELIAQAEQADVPVYLIVSPGNRAAIARLAASSGSPGAQVATDKAHVLAAVYHPVGLTVLLVDYRGSVTVAPLPLTSLQWARRLAGLVRSAG